MRQINKKRLAIVLLVPYLLIVFIFLQYGISDVRHYGVCEFDRESCVDVTGPVKEGSFNIEKVRRAQLRFTGVFIDLDYFDSSKISIFEDGSSDPATITKWIPYCENPRVSLYSDSDKMFYYECQTPKYERVFVSFEFKSESDRVAAISIMDKANDLMDSWGAVETVQSILIVLSLPLALLLGWLVIILTKFLVAITKRIYNYCTY